MKGKLKPLSTFLGYLGLLAVVIAFVSLRYIRQEQRNIALIHAIESNDATRVVGLLNRGADPNTHKTVNTGRPVWRVLLDMIRRNRPVAGEETALQRAIAVDLLNQRDMLNRGADSSPVSMESSYTILSALIRAGSKRSAESVKSRTSLDKAEQLMTDCKASLPFDDDMYDRQKAQKACTNYILASKGSAYAYAALADCWMDAGDYAAAIHWFSDSLLWQPSYAEALLGLRRAEEYLRIQRSILAQLPYGSAVLHVCPYPAQSSSKLWAAVYNVKVKGLRVAVYQDGLGGLTRLSEAGNLGHTDLGSGDDYDEVQLFVRDVTGYHAPQIVVHNVFFGASWAPSHLAIFAWRRGRLASILQADGSEPLEIVDLKHKGSYRINATYEIGTTMSHAAQPRWTDIYTYKNGRFVQSNRDFPEEYKHWVEDLRATLKEYPGDRDVREHLATVYDILGRHYMAPRKYSKARN